MGAIFSKIMAMAASEPAAAAPMLEFQGDVTCCNCESSSDEEESPRLNENERLVPFKFG